jgi:hypothetical protein
MLESAVYLECGNLGYRANVPTRIFSAGIMRQMFTAEVPLRKSSRLSMLMTSTLASPRRARRSRDPRND